MVKVLLRDNVEALGHIGDVVEVKPGHARNHLLPQGLAMEVTPANIARLAREKETLLAREASRKADFEEIGKRLAAASCTIRMAAAEGGHLYGAVSARTVAEALVEAGFPVEPRMVLMDEPIRELGAYQDRVRVRLHPEVEVPVQILVV